MSITVPRKTQTFLQIWIIKCWIAGTSQKRLLLLTIWWLKCRRLTALFFVGSVATNFRVGVQHPESNTSTLIVLLTLHITHY